MSEDKISYYWPFSAEGVESTIFHNQMFKYNELFKRMGEQMRGLQTIEDYCVYWGGDRTEELADKDLLQLLYDKGYVLQKVGAMLKISLAGQ